MDASKESRHLINALIAIRMAIISIAYLAIHQKTRNRLWEFTTAFSTLIHTLAGTKPE